MDQQENLNNYYPSQIREQLGGITFSSCFDSGNLGSVRRESTYKYILTIQNDMGTNNKSTTYRTWFHFSVAGFDDNTVVTFVIPNMQNQSGLFKDGMQPVFRNESSNEWQRIKYPCIYRMNDGFFELTYKHTFTSESKVYFAFSYPWSVEENDAFIRQLELTAQEQLPDVYFKNTTLMHSKEGRKLQLLTITTNNQQLRIEEPITNLFPLGDRPMMFKKKYIFVSARVHPGEVPGSFVLNGLLKFIMNPIDNAAQVARDTFVFVIVPIINPDGVYRGHYRTDSLCQNLNRYYINPSLQDHPTIYAIKEYIMRLHQTDRLYAYVDLHAHAGHKGIFIYGNQLPTLPLHTQSCLLPRLLPFYSEIFDYDGCNFTEKNMYAADKGDGLSKDGAGRVAIYKATNIVYSYTLECNYNTGKYTNIIYPETYCRTQDDIMQSYGNDQLDDQIVLNPLPAQTQNKIYFYTIADYETVGKAIVLGFLDIGLINPQSRIPESYFKTLPNLKAFLAYNIMKSMPFRFEIPLRKIIKNINNNQQIARTLKAFYDYLVTNQFKDNLESEQQQKPLTRYQKAQEIKQSKQNLKPLKVSQKEQYQSNANANVKNAIPLNVEQVPIKSYPFSAVDLDLMNQRKNVSQNKNRAKSEGKSSAQGNPKSSKQFKIKRISQK